MPFYGGEKWACYSCTKGHRSSKCQHVDRILYKVRKPGRPLNNCPHVLPDTIQPGTFVNTSAESMANGQLPKEACNCKNEMVQVAIPKIKHCSCITAITPPDNILSPGPALEGDSQHTVKTGRVTKPNTRRKKSSISEGIVRVGKADAGSDGGEVLTSPEEILAGSKNHHTENSQGSCCSDRRDQCFQPPPPKISTQATLQQTIISGMRSPQWNGMSSPTATSPVIHYHDNQSQHIKFPELGNVNSNTMLPYMEQTQNSPFPGIVTVSQIGQHSRNQHFLGTSTGHFQDAETRMGERIVISSFGASAPPQNNNGVNNDKIMVPLTHHEYLWIQAARSANVNFAELPKFVTEEEHKSNFRTQPSPIIQSRNGTLNHTSTPHIQDSVDTSPSVTTNEKRSCYSNEVTPAITEGSSGPSSPNCKCGEACLCVPCADHPNNPAMREHIKDNLQLIQNFDRTTGGLGKGTKSGSCCDSSEQSPGALYEPHHEEQSPDPIVPNDLSALDDFVFYNYDYSTGCSEGSGNCMCGEGCTCVGCLTHGGHDGINLESIGQETITDRGGQNGPPN